MEGRFEVRMDGEGVGEGLEGNIYKGNEDDANRTVW